jgi:hypothetical protein
MLLAPPVAAAEASRLTASPTKLDSLTKGTITAMAASMVLDLLSFWTGAVGICAGPNGKLNAIIILVLGICGMATAAWCAFQIVKGFSRAHWAMRLFGAFGLLTCALMVFLSYSDGMTAISGLQSVSGG